MRLGPPRCARKRRTGSKKPARRLLPRPHHANESPKKAMTLRATAGDAPRTDEQRVLILLTRKPCRTAFRSPWQNPVAERWIGNCRRELLDHVVVFHARHLVCLVRCYVAYFHGERPHQGLGSRLIEPDESAGRSEGPISCRERAGGMLRYYYREAA